MGTNYYRIPTEQEIEQGKEVHLGKRSRGWKFCWNFHNNEYYSNKQELIDFVLSGRVINEYEEELTPQAFLDMAFNWGEPDGWVVDDEYHKNNGGFSYFNDPKYYDTIIDGLRVSTSTDFC